MTFYIANAAIVIPYSKKKSKENWKWYRVMGDHLLSKFQLLTTGLLNFSENHGIIIKTPKAEKTEIVNDINEIITTVYKQFYNIIYHYCLENLFYHQQNAENITQTVFMIFVKKFYEVHPDKYKSWLISVADREIKSFKRKMSKTDIVDLDDYSDIISDNSLDVLEEIINKELLKQDEEIKQQIFSILKPNQRQLLQYIISGLSTAEISEKIGVERRKITVRTYNLRKKVREYMEKQKEKII